jgi:hypothetical protein
MFAVCTAFGLVVLLSIDATDDNIPVGLALPPPTFGHQVQGDSVVDKWSLSNVREGSDRLWASVVGAYLYSFVAFKLLLDLFKSVCHSVSRLPNTTIDRSFSTSNTVRCTSVVVMLITLPSSYAV